MTDDREEVIAGLITENLVIDLMVKKCHMDPDRADDLQDTNKKAIRMLKDSADVSASASRCGSDCTEDGDKWFIDNIEIYVGDWEDGDVTSESAMRHISDNLKVLKERD